ncbi:MAG: 4-(cytidine 5'-diphospho)-2-C-methyl-D-erythritol kinase [Cytophagales bacterium]|nr:4-(cytidine 5'-diphospho)-2-C-methyl-D-erythritol kinase [Rhizobacter sp.]
MALTALYDVSAPAKLNLFLHVLGRRDDGYHLLQSAFQLIDWADTLHFDRRTDGSLSRHDLTATLPADDLCLRAARALQAASGTTLGADISIDKQVPWGAGMGGGSSDAASTLLALNCLWGLNWPLPRLLALGLTLGADVPFFLGGHNAFVEGIGEQLTPLSLPRQWLAVLKPPAGIETRAIFASPLLARNTEAVIVAGFLAKAGIDALANGFGRNDLQPSAEQQCAEVAQAAQLLQARFGNSRMTGSGSAVFARAGTQDAPMATLPADVPPGWVGRMCRSLDHHPLLGWCPV